MDIRPLTPEFAVSPQITPDDIAEIAAQGFKTVICNRPDEEVPSDIAAAQVDAAAKAAGLGFVYLPVTHQTLTDDIVARQKQAIDGKTLAYCASGTRSSIVWGLGQTGEMAPDDVIEAGAKVGYDLSPLRARLER